jgi:hypothetical protein
MLPVVHQFAGASSLHVNANCPVKLYCAALITYRISASLATEVANAPIIASAPHAIDEFAVAPCICRSDQYDLKNESNAMFDKTTAQDAVNLDAIAALAEETHQPYEVVKDVYEEQFARLSAEARVTDYLILFASRRTRDVLANRRA